MLVGAACLNQQWLFLFKLRLVERRVLKVSLFIPAVVFLISNCGIDPFGSWIHQTALADEFRQPIAAS